MDSPEQWGTRRFAHQDATRDRRLTAGAPAGALP